jgi:hypothetical protein
MICRNRIPSLYVNHLVQQAVGWQPPYGSGRTNQTAVAAVRCTINAATRTCSYAGTAGQASQGNNHNACGSSTGASGRGRISPVASNISNNLDGCFKSDTAHKPAVPTAPEVLPLGVACGGQPRASSEHVGVSQLGQDSNRDSVHSPKEAIAELYARWQTEGQASAQDGCPLVSTAQLTSAHWVQPQPCVYLTRTCAFVAA